MAENRNPAAVGDGGSEADHPGRAIDPDLAHGRPANQFAPRRNGNAHACASCGTKLKPKRGSRRQRFCSPRCRSHARRDRNFSTTGHTGKAKARSVESSPAKSNSHKGENAGRAFPINLLGGLRWPGRRPLDAELVRKIVRTEICATFVAPLRDDEESSEVEARR